jgi:hypothetical protein
MEMVVTLCEEVFLRLDLFGGISDAWIGSNLDRRGS